jgi:hypothetical protein
MLVRCSGEESGKLKADVREGGDSGDGVDVADKGLFVGEELEAGVAALDGGAFGVEGFEVRGVFVGRVV